MGAARLIAGDVAMGGPGRMDGFSPLLSRLLYEHDAPTPRRSQLEHGRDPLHCRLVSQVNDRF